MVAMLTREVIRPYFDCRWMHKISGSASLHDFGQTSRGVGARSLVPWILVVKIIRKSPRGMAVSRGEMPK